MLLKEIALNFFSLLKRRCEKCSYLELLVKPGTEDALRVLYFENKAFSSDDDAELSWKRQDDNWRVSAGKKEIYLIPDAVIFGG